MELHAQYWALVKPGCDGARRDTGPVCVIGARLEPAAGQPPEY
jgi:hypothetical protein